eukprot:XP_004915964.1 PREDICTED: antileukoproteinase-like [Xenopus tropicalis]
MMLKVLIFSALLCLALVNGTKPKKETAEEVEAKNEKRGDCPVVPSGNNVTLPACNTTCPGGANCANIHCSIDTNCAGIEKCCNTTCGMKCVNPVYKTPCEEESDCAGTLICCKGICVVPKKGLAGVIEKKKCEKEERE